MRTNMKRILSILLSLTICLTMFPATVQVQAASVNDLSYTISGGQATITNCNESASGSLTIPDTIDGYPVTSIGNWGFSWCDSLISVTIPDSVTSIGKYAFWACDSLTSVTIPDSVTSIGDKAFYNCNSLTSVTIPDSVTSIGDEAFYNCNSLTGVTIPDSVTSIGEGAFSWCDSLASVTIADSVTSIENRVFYNCDILTSVTIPDSVTNIGNEAFYGCDSLTSVTIPDSVTSIGEEAFYKCSSITSIYFVGNAPSIVNAAFYGVYATAYYHTGTLGWADAAPESWIEHREGGSYGWITLQEVDHLCPSYIYDNNHTCTVDGTERAVCLTCGETDIRRVEGSAVGHLFVYTSNNDATCTQDGTKSATCSNCDLLDTITEENTALGHSFTNYVSNGDATCTQDGTKMARCDRCNATDSLADAGSALGHSFTNYIPNGDATCTQDGTKTAKCDRCDIADTQPDVGTMAHRYVDGRCIHCGEWEFTQASICGSVTAFGEGAIRLELVSESGERISLSMTGGTYEVEVVDPGQYTLTVSQSGCVTRSYSLTLGEEKVALDVKLYLIGDVTGDGCVNVGDVSKLYAHVRSTAPITDEYQLQCGNVNGGSVNVGDVSAIYAHIKGTKKLY